MDGLCKELPAYLACAKGVSFKADSMAVLAAMQESGVWWRQNEDNLPH